MGNDNLRGSIGRLRRQEHWSRALPLLLSEVKMQAELDDAVETSYAAASISSGCPDSAEAGAAPSQREVNWTKSILGIAIRFSELRMVGQIKEICRECEASLLSHWNLEILLQREIQVIKTGVSHVREETGSIPECLRYITAEVGSRG